jgi:RNA polymerase sigma-70 factor (ECF subfamily)
MQKISFRKDILPLKDKLYRLALRITLDSAEAEDIVQETMVRVWHKRDEWSRMESVEAYCLVVTKNLAIDRSEKMEAQNVSLDWSMDVASNDGDPAHQLEHSERLENIHRLINELPETQKLIMQLRDIEGKNYKEIAAILQLTEAQVKTYLFRARQKVKQKRMDIENYGL